MSKKAIQSVRDTFAFPVLLALWKFVILLVVYSTLAVVLHLYVFPTTQSPPKRFGEVVISTLLFGWLMQFRAVTAYDRWYEARKLWGQLVNASRNIMLKAHHLLGQEGEDLVATRRLLIDFARALRARLDEGQVRAIARAGPHEPMRITGVLYDRLAKTPSDPWKNLAMDTELRQLMEVCGACERIQSTPLTASYRGLLRKGIAVYLLALPWMLVDDIRWLAVPTTILVGYVLLALELIAHDIENPFGRGADDLPLDDVVKIIERSVEEYVTEKVSVEP